LFFEAGIRRNFQVMVAVAGLVRTALVIARKQAGVELVDRAVGRHGRDGRVKLTDGELGDVEHAGSTATAAGSNRERTLHDSPENDIA
jgi:hypothetical protein